MAVKQFEIYEGEDGRIYWRAVAGNNENVADGEGYERRDGALGGVGLMVSIPPDVEIVDLTSDPPAVLTVNEVWQLLGISKPAAPVSELVGALSECRTALRRVTDSGDESRPEQEMAAQALLRADNILALYENP